MEFPSIMKYPYTFLIFLISPNFTIAQQECGPEVAGANIIICSETIYPNGISYVTDGMTLIVDDDEFVSNGGIILDALTNASAVKSDVTVNLNSFDSVNFSRSGNVITSNGAIEAKGSFTENHNISISTNGGQINTTGAAASGILVLGTTANTNINVEVIGTSFDINSRNGRAIEAFGRRLSIQDPTEMIINLADTSLITRSDQNAGILTNTDGTITFSAVGSSLSTLGRSSGVISMTSSTKIDSDIVGNSLSSEGTLSSAVSFFSGTVRSRVENSSVSTKGDFSAGLFFSGRSIGEGTKASLIQPI